MITRTEARIGCAMLLAVAAWAGAQGPSRMPIRIASIPGTFQNCNASAVRCPIPVRVEYSASAAGQCIATVDTDFVRVAAAIPVDWYLAKTDMNDAHVYEFFGDGISWTLAASAAEDFASQSSGLSTSSRWVARSHGRMWPVLNYVPVVRIYGMTASCVAGDPKIHNDGP